MLVHPDFNPIAIDLTVIGLPLQVHWYGITYLIAFAQFWWLARRRTAQTWFSAAGWTRTDVDDLLFFGVVGVILGGRLGYVLFYMPSHYLAHPLEVFAIWKGGMSFHGGMLGVIAAMWWFGWRRQRPFFQITDLIAPCVPLGLASGRAGNFINGELWGRLADPSLPWAMVFPHSGSLAPRHPSQIYQLLLEGVLLFIVLWAYTRRARPRAATSALFLLGYGLMRFIAEYFREPDAFLGLQALGLSRGQWLCLPMLLAAVLIWAYSRRFDRPDGRGHEVTV